MRLMRWLLLTVLLVCMVSMTTTPATASVLSEFLLDTLDTGVVATGAVAEGASFLADAVKSPDAGNLLYVTGDRDTNVLSGVQAGFGSYDGAPFLGNIGVLTKEPAKGRLGMGVGTKAGSVRGASLNIYVEFVPDELSSYTLDPIGLPNWAVAVAAGVSVRF